VNDYHYACQDALCRRAQECGLVTQVFADPGTLRQPVERSLRELAKHWRRADGGSLRGGSWRGW
jgi:hypothetical protein